MVIPVHIQDPSNGKLASLHQANGYVGPIVFTEQLRTYTSRAIPFFNSDFGINMNIDATSSGTPLQIHNGEDTSLWTASQITGSKATFNNADTAGDLPISGTSQVLWNNGSVLDTIQFASGTVVDLSTYSSLSMQVLVDKDWSIDDSVDVYGWDTSGGVELGNRVSLSDHFNESDFDIIQSISIPLTNFGLVGETSLDAFRMQLTAKSGPAPKFYIDTIQLEQPGVATDTEFIINATKGTKFHVDKAVFSLADIGTGGTAYAYDKIGALAALTNGINIEIASNSEKVFSLTIRQLSDWLSGGAIMKNHVDDGTNTYYTINIDFNTPIILDSREEDYFKVTISDDLSGLLLFRGFGRGREEEI